ncbi:MAG: hypothetical protein KF694_12640 [Mesorhizobium sp.]|nr:hypothetical protein [Mesorhizobium sp.]
MPFYSYANQHDIDAMTKALDAYCRECAITDEEGRTAVAERIASLFFSGRASADEILDALWASNGRAPPSLTGVAA